jgi:hypothetical protein
MDLGCEAVRYLSEDFALAIPSSYSCKINQMVAHETQDLYLFRHVRCPSPLGGDAASLVFICLVTGAGALSNYALE